MRRNANIYLEENKQLCDGAIAHNGEKEKGHTHTHTHTHTEREREREREREKKQNTHI